MEPLGADQKTQPPAPVVPLPEAQLATSGRLDFVCNDLVMFEKQGARIHVSQARLNLVTLAPVCFALLVVVPGVLLLSISALIFQSPGLSSAVTTLLLLLGVIGFCLLCWLFRQPYRTGFPTNLILRGHGLVLAWLGATEFETVPLPYESIKSLSADKHAGEINPGIVMEISTAGMPLSTKFLSYVQTASLWKHFWPWVRKAGRFDMSSIVIRFPLDSLTLDADRMRLIAALKARVGESAVAPEFTELLEGSQAPTFTQLWLDDMQSFRRARIEDLAVGATLQDGRYEVQSKIATGGQAKIYAAIDTSCGRLVALKELVLPVSGGSDVRSRSFSNVKNEAILLGSLDHPGIVKLLDNFVEDHRAYVVLEHIDGVSLRKRVQDGGAIDQVDVIKISRQIAHILAYLHGLSPPLVHRDLTPDNLMLTSEFQVRLLDFNVAQQLESNSTKTVVGKHNYMAPEQFRGKPTTQSDLYSFGATLYFLLTAEDPLPLAPSRASNKVNVDSRLDDLIARLTAPELSERYQLIDEVRAALDCFA